MKTHLFFAFAILLSLFLSTNLAAQSDTEENTNNQEQQLKSEQVLIDGKIYLFTLAKAGLDYNFEMRETEGNIGSTNFTFSSLDLAKGDQGEIFDLLLTRAFFNLLKGDYDYVADIDEEPNISPYEFVVERGYDIDSLMSERVFSEYQVWEEQKNVIWEVEREIRREAEIKRRKEQGSKELNERELSAAITNTVSTAEGSTKDKLESVKSIMDDFRTNLPFDGKSFLASVSAATRNVDYELRQGIDEYAGEIVEANQLGHKLMKEQLIEKARNLVSDFPSGSKRGSKRDTSANYLFTYLPGVDADLTEKYRKSGRYLNRRSVEIGNEIYSLSAKAINAADGNKHYVFNLKLGNKESFFEMDDVRANASTINAMAGMMKRALQVLKLNRNAQLPSHELDRITEIANRLKSDPDNYSLIDDNYLETVIDRAADRFGFSSQELIDELKTTGIFASLEKRRLYAGNKRLDVRQVDLNQKINHGAVNYTKFINDLDKELRDVASDFLFVAYKNSIEVETDDYVIGKIKISEVAPVYRRKLTYEKFESEREAQGKRKDDLYPVCEVDLKSAQIEFESEQITNIKLNGEKIGEPIPSYVIKEDQEKIYVEIGNVIRELQLPGQRGMDALNYDPDSVVFEGQPLFNKSGNKIGDLSMYIENVNFTIDSTGSDEPKKKKEIKEVKSKSVSFDYFIVLKANIPTEEAEYDPTILQRYLSNYLVDGKPIGLNVNFYNDNQRQVLLYSNEVIPNLIVGSKVEVIPNYEKGSLVGNYYYDYKDEYDYLNSKEWNRIYSLDLEVELLPKYHPGLNTDVIIPNTGEDVAFLKTTTSLRVNQFASFSLNASKANYFPNRMQMVFTNPYPISYSTKDDITYSRFDSRPKRQKRLYLPDNEHFVLLKDVLSNDYRFYNKTENYSPKDDVIYIEELNETYDILKEPTKDILKARIYSDFIGFDESNPNGLVQTEVSKRFFLNTASTSGLKNAIYSGLFNYIEPSLLIAKIEENNKFLELSSLSYNSENTGLDTTVNYVSSLDILNYSSLRIGAQFGLGYVSIPKLHTKVQLGIAGFINQSGFANQQVVPDTAFNTFIRTENEFLGNSLVFYPDIRLEFNPDPRFGLELAYRPTWVSLLSRNVEQVDNENRFIRSGGLSTTTNNVHVFQLLASIRINKEGNGQFFFRSNFSVSGDDPDTNFLQAQIGYAFNIFARDKNAGGISAGPKPDAAASPNN